MTKDELIRTSLTLRSFGNCSCIALPPASLQSCVLARIILSGWALVRAC
jgi:hypothetical protein